MRVSRIYFDTKLEAGNKLELDRDTSHYLARVLRLQPGHSISIFNQHCGEFDATLTAISKHSVSLSVGDRVAECETPKVTINLALGLSRGDRMDFAIQKSTELGVSRIIPIYSDYGEVRIKQASRLENKMRHWRRIAINACEQCGRISVPALEEPGLLSDWLQSGPDGMNLVLDPSGQVSLGEQNQASTINLLIGPEGGLSQQELATAAEQGFTLVTLGPRVLRTETAPVAALAILQHRYGDL